MARMSLLLLFIVIIICGCGLPSPYFLSPPGLLSTQANSGNQVFTINVTTTNIDQTQYGIQFQGFELYYKFYSDQNLIDNNLSSNPNIDEYDLRNTYHFLPVCSQLDVFSGTPPADLHYNKPLVKVQDVDKGTVFSITIAFFNTPYTPPVVQYNGTPMLVTDQAVPLSIRRNAGDTTPIGLSSTSGQPKPFVQLLASDPNPYPRVNLDPDVQPIWTALQNAGTGVAYLAMYALSYGLQGFSTPIYSSPVYLGYVQVTMNP